MLVSTQYISFSKIILLSFLFLTLPLRKKEKIVQNIEKVGVFILSSLKELFVAKGLQKVCQTSVMRLKPVIRIR